MKKAIYLVGVILILSSCRSDKSELESIVMNQSELINDLQVAIEIQKTKINEIEIMYNDLSRSFDKEVDLNASLRNEISELRENSTNTTDRLESVELVQYLDNNLERKLKFKALINRGFTEEEMFRLNQDEIDVMFSPGAYGDGAGVMELISNEDLTILNEKGLFENDIERLSVLGFGVNEIINMTEELIDFIFPIEDLEIRLYFSGYSKEEVNIRRLKGETYRDIIIEALEAN